MNNINIKYFFPFILLLILVGCNKENKEYTYNKGQVFGTYYSITYLHPKGEDLQEKIEDKFKEFDNSLSTFNPNSTISKINQNDTSVVTDTFFDEMYAMAQQVSTTTEGAFDITVAPLVSAWGFGFGKKDNGFLPNVDTILPYIGYQKIELRNQRLIKQDNRIMLDASAIAKGQSCDVIAALLDENGCENYMVEIGGEVFCKGLNPKGEKWHIGVDKPHDDPANEQKELQIILEITGVGMATSGNYRQFYVKDGKKYAHTIDPRIGYPVSHNLLSATVIAPTCMEADAYATAFMVLGVEKSLELCNSFSEIDCYLIFTDNKGELQTVYTDGFEKYFRKENQ